MVNLQVTASTKDGLVVVAEREVASNINIARMSLLYITCI